MAEYKLSDGENGRIEGLKLGKGKGDSYRRREEGRIVV